MTRLTPEDEKRIRAASTNGWRLLHAEERHLLNEIDALRAEIEKLTKELLDARAEIATFRNASPSLCNCSQCRTLNEKEN